MDERVLGAGTNARFASLLLLLVAASGSMLLPVLSARLPNDLTGCQLAAGVDVDHAAEIPSVLRLTGQMLAYLPCTARYAPSLPWWQILAGPPIVVVVAGVTTVLLPLWKQRSGRRLRLDSVAGGAEVASRVRELAEGRVALFPDLFVAPSATTKSAAVFGTNGRPRLCLDGGLVVCRTTDPQTFDAVVLHELGHVANRDLTITYATVALWRSFIALVVIPYVLWWSGLGMFGLGAGAGPSFTPVSARNLALPVVTALVVYVARADVLRARELHADLTAHRWGAPLEHVWAAMPVSAESGRLRQSASALLDQLRTHPRWEVRREALDDPAPLFAVSWVLMFLTGTIATLTGFHMVWYFVPHQAEMSGWIDQGLAAVPSAVVAAATTAVLWRSVVRAAILGVQPPSGVRAGVWLGLGLIVGSLVNGLTTGDLWLPRRWWALALVVAAAVAFTCWTTQCARLAAVAWPGRSLRWPLTVCLIAGWLILSAWFVWWEFVGAIYVNGFWYDQAGNRSAMAHWIPGAGTVHPDTTAIMAQTVPVLQNAAWQALTPAAAVAAWVVPLALWASRTPGRRLGWLRSSASTGESSASSGEGREPSEPAMSPSWRAPALRRAIVAALIGAAVTVLGIVGTQAWLHSLHAAPGQRGGIYAFSYAIWSLWAITAGSAVSSVIAAASARFRLPTALVASGISALLGLGAAVVLISLDGCVQPLAVLNTSCAWRPAWRQLQGGNTFALLAHSTLLIAPVTAVAVTALSAIARRAVRAMHTPADSVVPQSPAATSPTTGRRFAGAGSAAGICALAFATAAVLMTGDARRQLATQAQRVTPAMEATFQQQAGLPVLPVPRDMRWRQVHAWYRLGGRYLLDHATRDYLSTATLLTGALNNSRVDVTSDLLAKMRPVCVDVRNVASWEPYYFQVPDPTAQESWHRFGAAWQAGQDCIQAVDHSDANAFLRAIAELWPAEKAAVAASNRVRAVIVDPSDSVYKGQPTPPPPPRL